MPSSITLEAAYESAIYSLNEAHGDISKLPSIVGIFLLVYSAQGVIDNGGFQYFFEMDWPNNIPYSEFVEAYRQIGALESANSLEQAVRMFDFKNPHLDENKRILFMDHLDRNHPFFGLGDSICGNPAIWQYLSDFINTHHQSFPCTPENP